MTSKIQLGVQSEKIQAFLHAYPELAKFIYSLIKSYEQLWAPTPAPWNLVSRHASSAYLIWSLRLQDAMQFLQGFFIKLEKEEDLNETALQTLFKLTLEEDQQHSRDNVLGDLDGYSNFEFHDHEEAIVEHAYFPYLNLSARSNLILLFAKECLRTPLQPTQCFHQLIANNIIYLLKYHDQFSEEKPHRFATIDLLANPETLSPVRLCDLHGELLYIPEKNMWLSLSSFFPQSLPFHEAIEIIRERVIYLYRMQKPIYDAMCKQYPLSDIVKKVLPTTYYAEIERLFKKLEEHLTPYEANLTMASLSMENFSIISSLTELIDLDLLDQIRLHPFDLHEPYNLKKLFKDLWKENITNNTLLWALRTFLTRYKDHPCSGIPLPPEMAFTHLTQHQSTIEKGNSSLSTTSPTLPLNDEYIEFVIQCFLKKIDTDSIHSLIMSFNHFQNQGAIIAKLSERLLSKNYIEVDLNSLATIVAYSGRKLGMILFEKIISHFKSDPKLILSLLNQLKTTLPESNRFFPEFLSQSKLLDERRSFLSLLIEHYRTRLQPILMAIAEKTDQLYFENQISSLEVLYICRICQPQPQSHPLLNEREYDETMRFLSTAAFGQLKIAYDEKRMEFKLFILWLNESLINAYSENRVSLYLLEDYLKIIRQLEQNLHFPFELLNYFDLNERRTRSESQMRHYSSYPAEQFLQTQGMSPNGLPFLRRDLLLPEPLLNKYYFKTLSEILRQVLATHLYRQPENIECVKDRILPYFKQLSVFWTNLLNEFSPECSATILRLLNQRVLPDSPLSKRDLFSYFLGSTRYLLGVKNELEREDAFAEFYNSLHPNYFDPLAASTSHLFLDEANKILFIEILLSFKDLNTMEQFLKAFIEKQSSLLTPNEEITFTKIFQLLNCRQHTQSHCHEIDIYFYFLQKVNPSNDFHEKLIYSLNQLHFASRNTLSLLLKLLPTHLYELFFELANRETLLRDSLASINLCQLNTHKIQCAWPFLKGSMLEVLQSNRKFNWNDYFHYCLRTEESFNKFLSLLAPDILTSFTKISHFLRFMNSMDYQIWHEKILTHLPLNYLGERVRSFDDLLQLANYSNSLTSKRAKKVIDDLLNTLSTYVFHERILNEVYRRIFEIQTHPIIKHMRIAIEPFLFSLLEQSPDYFKSNFKTEILILCIMIDFPKLNEYLEKLKELKWLNHIIISPHFHYFENTDSTSLFIALFFKIRNAKLFQQLFYPTVPFQLSGSDLNFLIQHPAMHHSYHQRKLFEIYDIEYLCSCSINRESLEQLFHYAQSQNQTGSLVFILNAYLEILCDMPLPTKKVPLALLNQLLYSDGLQIEWVIQTEEQFFNLCRSMEWPDLKLFWSLRHKEILIALDKLNPTDFSTFACQAGKCLRPEHLRALWQNKPFYFRLDKLYPSHESLAEALYQAENRILLCKALSPYLQDRFKTEKECRDFLLHLKKFIENSSEFTEMAMTIFPQFRMDNLRLILTNPALVASSPSLTRSRSCLFLLPKADPPSLTQPPTGYHLRRSASQP